uniref:MATH domain-containing protein n=1 Tax=Oryza glumipatula TaxID=40148 RepID=A0A0E0BTK3_9ORYZ
MAPLLLVIPYLLAGGLLPVGRRRWWRGHDGAEHVNHRARDGDGVARAHRRRILRHQGIFAVGSGVAVNEHVKFGTFVAGGHSWYIKYLPNITAVVTEWVSDFVCLNGKSDAAKKKDTAVTMKARCKLTLLDGRDGKAPLLPPRSPRAASSRPSPPARASPQLLHPRPPTAAAVFIAVVMAPLLLAALGCMNPATSLDTVWNRAASCTIRSSAATTYLVRCCAAPLVRSAGVRAASAFTACVFCYGPSVTPVSLSVSPRSPYEPT